MTDAELQLCAGCWPCSSTRWYKYCAVVAEERMREPAFLALVADTHAAIAAVDAELIEGEGDAP
jgi:hypothetical protein